MSSAKHTPGPWYPVIDHVYKDVGDTRCLVAMVARDWGEKEDVANTNLIAAAPELLSHLQFAVSLLTPIAGHTAQIERMRAVIAKATGSAS